MCDEMKSEDIPTAAAIVIDSTMGTVATTTTKTISNSDMTISNDNNATTSIDLYDEGNKDIKENENNEIEKLNNELNCHDIDTDVVVVVSADNKQSMTAVAPNNNNNNNNIQNDNNNNNCSNSNECMTASAVTVVLPETTTIITTNVDLVQQKLEMTPKTVESESQTDITVTNDYCKSVVADSVTLPLQFSSSLSSLDNKNSIFAADAATDININSNSNDTIIIDYNNESEKAAILITNNINNNNFNDTDKLMKKTATITIDCNEIINNNKDINLITVNMNLNKNEINQNKNDKILNYIDEPEISLIEIKEKLIEIDNKNDNEKTANSESEEDDQLKPLMTFNHAVTDNQEYYNYGLVHPHHQYVKHLESKDSYNSTDNDVQIQDCNRISTSLSHHHHYQQQQQQQKDNENLDVSYSPSHHHYHSHHHHQHNINKDSTICEKEIDTLSPSEIPDDQMCENIVEHVEYYFSNDSILRDAFLLKHVRRNKEGFVSLKLISSFKRVRQLTKDWRVVGNAIHRKSNKIELNDLGTKIRRLEPLPSFDETMPSRTIVVCDLPYDKLCIEKVSDIFSKCGEIALIRILRPGMGIPVDVRQFMNKYPEMQQKECALVEYIESHSARNALNLNDNFRVYEMVAPRKKTGKKSISVTKMIENYKFIDHNYERSRGGSSGIGGNNIINNNNVSGMNMNTSSLENNNYKYNNTIRRNSADYYTRSDQQQQQQQQYPHQHQSIQQSMPQHIYTPRRYSFNDANNKNNNNNNNNNNMNNNNMNNDIINNYGQYPPPRRISSCSMNSSDYSRKYSSCSEGYSSCSDISRRTSTCSSSDQSRRTSNCSDYCPCSRRSSQCSDIYHRRISSCSDHNNHILNNNNNNNNNQQRKFSNGSGIFSSQNPQNNMIRRRISMDSNYERKISTGSIGSNGGGGGGINGNGNNNNNNTNSLIMQEQQQQQQQQQTQFRKYSNGNGYDLSHKLANNDQYYNDRRISIDSGYDRKLSFSSDYSSSPRSRSNSFLMCHQHKNIENVVRTPIGPDGSKGFTQRTRKLGQIVPPV